ncbi:MAG: bifunctional 4-hydroxy-2-oxoglutarate aldolase/2-dehydro-3-deoxy-phosphogluconate aldolase [Oscillospiraceae bacterium]|nr:bifunctional 4-hydroxy-2-oxoglutarate aldolase/2-dehydro-3-deoxy-phosphogluconate aldolase [Oscillospiraceae bacterium]
MDRIKRCGIVPVIKLNDAAKAAPLAGALLEGGVDVIEITFRTAAAAAAIESAAREFPEMLVGAGTVLTAGQLETARDAGARFIVSPGFDADIVKAGLDMGLIMLPGCVTPTEVMAALKLGVNTLKFFPAENFGGAAAVRALCAPFGNVTFVPTGGISEKNAADYWKMDKVIAVGGSWMAPESLINEGGWAEITRRTREAVELMRSVRGSV